MRNVWLIWRKEMRSYFVSPIAYILLLMCALIFGFFFWSLLQAYLQFSMEAQMRGEMFPMNMPEEITRRLFGNIPVTGLFIIPLITMRLFSEEKRTGTIELLTTSPIRDGEVILGKWLAATTMYGCLLLLSVLNIAFLFMYSHPDWKPILVSYLVSFCKPRLCWRSEHFSRPSRRIKSLPVPRRSAPACCYLFVGGLANTTAKHGHVFSRTYRCPRIWNRSREELSTRRT